jgi:uncharacterized protein (TIGR01244 family)
MKHQFRLFVGVALAALVVTLNAQGVTKETLPGVTNFSRVETTIACAGATTPAAVAGLKKMGYASIIDLREASEPGADIDGEAAAAKAASINFIHLPFNGVSLSPALVDSFLTAVTAPANQPVFVHCASANRAAAMWMIKRIKVDMWDVDRASAEAAALGLTNSALKTFVLQYVQAGK